MARTAQAPAFTAPPAAPLRASPRATALQTINTSSVPASALAVLQWVIFDNVLQADAIAMYNAAGYGRISSHHGISKKLLRWGPAWYAEQGAKRPWKLFSRRERETLVAGGLGEADFPVVDPRRIGRQGVGTGRRSRRRGVNVGTVSNNGRQIARGETIGPKSLLIRLRIRIPDSHRASSAPPDPIPNELKNKILSKHDQWHKACSTGKAHLADAVEAQLDTLESEAKRISLEGFKAWKFGTAGYAK